jgi:hypothetical protein
MPASVYSPEIAQSIIEQLSEGIPLRVICRQPGMPAWRTIYDWLDKDEQLSTHVARARLLGYDAIAEECLDIADDSSGDYRLTDKGRVYDPEHVQRSKLRVETRLKLLACWASSKYGARTQVAHSGTVGHTDLTDDELTRRLAELEQARAQSER